MKLGKDGLRHLVASTGYSLAGLRTALRETAFRHELLLGVAHVAALAWLRPAAWAVVLLSALYGMVLVVELLNTALERVVDLASPGYHALAKEAKDLASAAVFVSLALYFAAWAAASWLVGF